MGDETGTLLPSDELLIHQTVDTFGRVSQSDRSWTEKICGMAAAKDGSIQLAFGLGKYLNRNVMDGWAGISQGTKQWTVRASRELGADPETTIVGPIEYEILEMSPKRIIRFALKPNKEQPIAFEWIAESDIPPFAEDREVHYSRDRLRLNADVIRFHQSGTARGWVEIEGERTEFDSGWVATRDRSWGVRYHVGKPLTDIIPAEIPKEVSIYALWFPAHCKRLDGTSYGLHFYYQQYSAFGFEHHSFQGGVEHPNGHRDRFIKGTPDLRFDDRTRRIIGGTFTASDESGKEYTYTITPVSDTGFHLATALYGGYEDHWHGEWRGDLHVEGEYVDDCKAEANLDRVRHHRMALVRVEDGEGGVGYGDLQTLIRGEYPDIGLTDKGVLP